MSASPARRQKDEGRVPCLGDHPVGAPFRLKMPRKGEQRVTMTIAGDFVDRVAEPLRA